MASNLYSLNKIIKEMKFVFAIFPPLYWREYSYETSEVQTWAPWKNNDKLEKIFSDGHYRDHQCRRSLMIIDSLKQATNSKFFSTKWHACELEASVIREFPNLNFVDYYVDHIDLARDSIHIGPKTHAAIAEKMWVLSEQYFYA